MKKGKTETFSKFSMTVMPQCAVIEKLLGSLEIWNCAFHKIGTELVGVSKRKTIYTCDKFSKVFDEQKVLFTLVSCNFPKQKNGV